MREDRTPEPSTCVPLVHKPSSKRNTRLFVWFAVPALKLVSLSLGCGPSEGENGGTCKESFCGRGGLCDEGLSCGQNNKCGPIVPRPPPAPSCSNFPTTESCAANESTRSCPRGADVPSTCRTHSEDDAGTRRVCCTTCFRTDRCESPAIGFECVDGYTPSQTDPSLQCVVVGWDYCCAPNTCFKLGGQTCIDGGGQAYACTGTATPLDGGLACTASPYAPGEYCCAARDAAAD